MCVANTRQTGNTYEKTLCRLARLGSRRAPFAHRKRSRLYRGFEGSGGYKEAPYPGAVWTGFYAGVNAGYGWSAEAANSPAILRVAWPPAAARLAGYRHLEGSEGFSSATTGKASDASPLVLGVETDVQAPSVIGKGHDLVGDAFTSRLQMFGTARGRIGYAYGIEPLSILLAVRPTARSII